MPCCAEVNDTGSTGLVSIASPVSTSRHAGFCIPIRRSASLRHDLRQEPYAVTPHVRICAGGDQQWPSLPRPLNQYGINGDPRKIFLKNALHRYSSLVVILLNE